MRKPLPRGFVRISVGRQGGEKARETLRKHLAQDPCPATRAEIAQALGNLGDPRDGELLLATLRDSPGPAWARRSHWRSDCAGPEPPSKGS